MPKFELKQLFDYKNVTPSGLVKGNLIYFKYQSPKGVHDNTPLVYVLDRAYDKFYGLNLHYEHNELQALTETIDEKINNFLENKYFSKHPEKRKELREQRIDFDKSIIESKELTDFMRGFNKRDLEVFPTFTSSNESNFRCYLYKRMNNVSKLIWKIPK